jgi:hypothetical protein
MRTRAGRGAAENRFAGLELRAPVSDLKGNFAFHHLEPLVLIEMQVQWQAAGHQVTMLNGKEIAPGVGW